MWRRTGGTDLLLIADEPRLEDGERLLDYFLARVRVRDCAFLEGGDEL